MNEIEDDNEFRVGDTRRYLKERDQRNQSKEKEVDRKASKNRKIRFNVHPKLMNFMPSTAANEVEARD